MLGKLILFSTFVTFGFSTCPNGGYEYQSNCYYYNAEATGFGLAEVYCNSLGLGGHLAAIHDAFANVVIGQEAQNEFNQSIVTDLWIGASNLILNGKWNWTDGSALDFNNWNKGEPQNILGYNCAALTMKDGYWAAQDCYQPKTYVCAVPAPAYPLEYNCTDGWLYYPPTGSCYQMRTFNGTWFEAEAYCQAIMAGAHQASIHSYAEFQLLYSFTFPTSDNLMLGLFTDDNYQTWNATDGTAADFLSYNKYCGTKFNMDATDKAARIYAAIGFSGRPCYFTRLAALPQYHVLCKKIVT